MEMKKKVRRVEDREGGRGDGMGYEGMIPRYRIRVEYDRIPKFPSRGILGRQIPRDREDNCIQQLHVQHAVARTSIHPKVWRTRYVRYLKFHAIPCIQDKRHLLRNEHRDIEMQTG